MRYGLFALLSVLSTASHASPDTWVCENNEGKSYESSKNVVLDTCRVATPEYWKAQTDKFVESRKIKPFCSTPKGAVCEVVGESTESGSIDGTRYSLYTDSASAAAEPGGDPGDYQSRQWSISCSRDKMSNQRSCAVSRGALWVLFRGSSSTVSVGAEHFPGSATSIKIGSRRFDTAQRDGNFTASQQIIDLLKDGQPVVTRYMKWPNRYWVDDEFTVSGFQTSAKLARWLLKNGTFK